MKRLIILFLLATASFAYAQDNVVTVATFKGIQVTGVTVSDNGRIFANFPRWRKDVPFSVVEIMPDGTYLPYPDKEWNSWEIGQETECEKFIAVQSAVTNKDKLYVLETGNPLFKGIVTSPKVYVFDLKTNKLIKTIIIEKSVVKPNSYVNDLRIDDNSGNIYFTDSGAPGIIIFHSKTNKFIRVLDNHLFTKAEAAYLTFKGIPWHSAVGSDGIELDKKKDILYFHALTGYTLYGINTADLLDTTKLKSIVPFQIRTGATDGMIMDSIGNLYFADLENDRIQYLTSDRKEIKTLIEGNKVRWADTFSIYKGYLYYTNSRINEASGDISLLEFTVNKVKLPNQ